MIQWGARRGAAEMMKVFQSARDRGEKSFIPFGQLFFSRERDTVRHSWHFTNNFVEYLEARVIG
jgi:hypothetical protein